MKAGVARVARPGVAESGRRVAAAGEAHIHDGIGNMTNGQRGPRNRAHHDQDEPIASGAATGRKGRWSRADVLARAHRATRHAAASNQ